MNTALLLSIIIALGILAQWLSWYLKQPSILFLLAIGLIMGPITHVFNPDLVMGNLLFPFISLGVAVILFEGALTLEFHEIKQHGKVVHRLTSIGVVITILIVSLTAWLFFDMDAQVALLFGSLVCVTGPTVIAPLLRSVRPNKTISNILKWESILIDPIGAIAVVLVYEYIISDGHGNSLFLFGKIIVVAGVIGLIGATILSFLIKRHFLPEFLRNVFTLAYILLLFSISNYFEHESGLLTVTVLGVALANWPKFPRDHLLEFNESLTILLISVLFIVLAARINLHELFSVGIGAVFLTIVIMFVARPLAVWVSSYRSKLTINEKLMISWIGPRGIVAAAISSLFAIKLQQYDLKGVNLLVPLVFFVIISTVLIQGLGAKMVGTLLKVREPANNGVLIIGANSVSLKIAGALKNQGFEVLVADNHYTQVAKARMEGLRTYFGNPISEHAERHLDLIGIGHLFAMSTDKELNTLCQIHFHHEFGECNIYRLKLGDEKGIGKERDKNQQQFVSNWLFSEEVTYAKLASLVSKNARIKITNITENYSYEQYLADNKHAIILYSIDKTGTLRVFTGKTSAFSSGKDIKIIALTPEENEPKTDKAPELTHSI